jgi:ABC-type multidrug transport system ATPase subunit
MDVVECNRALAKGASLGRIVASGLTLIENGQPRIAGLSLTVRRGEIVGLTAESEQGADLCLGLLAGHIKPTFGVLQVCGTILRHRPPRWLLGTNLDVPPTDSKLTGGEWFEKLATEAGYRRGEARRRSASILADLDLRDKDGTPVAELSEQERALFALGAATVANPPAVIARQPLRGLDSWQSRVVRALLRRWSLANRAVLISAHPGDLNEGDCSRLYRLNDEQVTARTRLEHATMYPVARGRAAERNGLYEEQL